ncbi:MAG TPA: 3-oxoacyl-[acyl-carrier-protein] synthase III C-terminal domain-containing protein [Planctomycetota bacterium]|nr:3-oxoacyl-[acyl-carrier-protein] synthase III C-terminal domain-containing protein [Planctomycetota bacterium]
MTLHPTLASVASAFPPQQVERDRAFETMVEMFPGEDPRSIASLLDRSGVGVRHVAPSLEFILGDSDFSARNAQWYVHSLELSQRAIRKALERARLSPADIDCVIDVSCTGVTIPALDAELVPMLSMRNDVRRIPITESGCAAGGLALGLAHALARGGERVLVLAVEVCSLTLPCDKRTRTDLVAAALFADGAAAAVVQPQATETPCPRILATGSFLIPGTLATMGFDVGTHGLRIVLQRELPDLLAVKLHEAVDAFLARHGKTRADIGLHLLHPGGRRVLEIWEAGFDLEPGSLVYSRESLTRYGNLSSASVLTVIELALEAGARVAPGKVALAAAVGPGLALEFLLLEWPSHG